MVETVLVAGLALVTAGIGVVGGLGGAILFVPALVLSGMPPVEAAPLGMFMVAAGSLGAAAPQLGEGMVNHRIGVVGELGASLGVLAGVALSEVLASSALLWVLAVAAVAAAIAGSLRTGLRNEPDGEVDGNLVGEQPGRLAGAYRLSGEVVPYRAGRVPLSLVALGLVGVVAGMTGTSGGYLKTPILSEVMHIPVKVAAATVTFMVGISAAAGLVAYGVQGRLDVSLGAVVVLGGLTGGRLGGLVQIGASPAAVRRTLGVILGVVAVLLLAK